MKWPTQPNVNYLQAGVIAARHNINVVVYEFPWPEVAKGNEYFNNEILSFYKNLLKDTVKGNPYIHFVDYEHFWPHELFMDPLHLNQMGANKLSKEYISKWCVDYIECFPRGDSGFNVNKNN